MEHGRKGLDQPEKTSTGSPAGPFPASSFIAARARLLNLIRGGANAVVLLDGESGSGKSYLATLVADDLAREGRRVFLTGGKELRTDGADVLLIDEADTLGDAGLSALAAWRAGQTPGERDGDGGRDGGDSDRHADAARRRAVLVLVARSGAFVEAGTVPIGDPVQDGIARVTLGPFSDEEVRRFALRLAAPTEITDYGLSRIVEVSGGRPRVVRTLVQAALIEALIDEEGMVCERHVLSAAAGVGSDSAGRESAPATGAGDADEPAGGAPAAPAHSLSISGVSRGPPADANAPPASLRRSGQRAAGMIGFAAAALLSANLVFLAVGYPPMDAALSRAGGRSGAAAVRANEAKADLSARTPRPIPGAPSIPAPIPPRPAAAPDGEAATDPADLLHSESGSPIRRAAPRAQRPFVDIVRPPGRSPAAASEPSAGEAIAAPPPTPARSQTAPLTLADIATPPPAPVPPAPAAEQQPDDEDRDDTEAERLSNAAQAARDRLRSVRR